MGMILIIAFILGGAGLIYKGIFGAQTVRLDFGAHAERAPSQKIRIHSLLCGIFPFTPRILEQTKLDIQIRDKLNIIHTGLAPHEFLNLKILAAIVLAVLSVLIFGKVDPIVCLVAALLGFTLPEIWLNKKIAARKYEIVRIMPETVDLLGLCVEAGLDFSSAVRWVIEKVPANPLIEELNFVLKEIEWGKSRTQALKDMAKRLSIPDISSFVQTLVQAERMGTPVSEAFAILSEDSRLQRFHRGERIALQAPIKILIPLIFCILPVIGIVIGGPILLQFMKGKMF